jgi:hypothetical protein
MTEGWMDNTEDFAKWDATQMASYLKAKADLGDYYEMIVEHKVTGEVAPRLTDADLKEMGIASIGDRKRFSKALSGLQKEHRKQEREKVLWEDEEVLWFSCWEAGCVTCCGCCPQDPAQYSLTGTHLIIKTIKPCRIGPIPCCCQHEYDVDNIDLTHVTDADVKGKPPPCCQQVLCCAKAQDHITIKTTSDGTKVLVLHKGKGEVISRKILNQVEEAQKMERD